MQGLTSAVTERSIAAIEKSPSWNQSAANGIFSRDAQAS